MSATGERSLPKARRLPPSETAVVEKAAERSGKVARGQFSRTFADVLSGRFGGRWTVDWEGARSPLASDRDERSFTDKVGGRGRPPERRFHPTPAIAPDE